MTATLLITAGYFCVTGLFILGLKRMASPVTARNGIVWAGMGMVLATLVTFAWPGMSNYSLMITALALGGGFAAWSGKAVKMTDMPQMVALYNGMGGGAAAAISAIKLLQGEVRSPATTGLAILGGLIGTVSFSGSLVAFAKLQGIMNRTFRLPGQNIINSGLMIATIAAGLALQMSMRPDTPAIMTFYLLALVLGVTLTAPIGGADMPVVISLFNALTGLAVGFEGFVLNNPALIIAGIVVGAAGTLLTQLMAKAMNRRLMNILFHPLTGEARSGVAGSTGAMKEIFALDAAAMMRYAQKVIIVPGYGMAVGQAQHKVKEMCTLLSDAGVEVRFAIHPVAGRMPGHMNVLLAEAGVPYELIFDLEEINNEFSRADVALVIGANDVVNPAARSDRSSPLFGMPILNADQSHNVIVVKRGQGAGYSGVENPLFFADSTRMLYGSAQQAVAEVIKHLKEMGS